MAKYRISFEIVAEKREIIDVYTYETTMRMVEILNNQGFKILSIMLND